MMCGDPVFSANREMQSRFGWDPLIQLMMAFLRFFQVSPSSSFAHQHQRERGEQINKIEKFLCTFGSFWKLHAWNAQIRINAAHYQRKGFSLCAEICLSTDVFHQ